MKWLFLLLLAALISTGCGQTEPLPTEVPVAEIVATIPPTPEPTVVAEPEPAFEPEPVAQEEVAEPTAEPTAEPPTLTVEPDLTRQPETPVEETVAFNGFYENSYFRGSADAPVTILDYSDFL